MWFGASGLRPCPRLVHQLGKVDLAAANPRILFACHHNQRLLEEAFPAQVAPGPKKGCQFAVRELPVNSNPPAEGATKGPCTIFDIWPKVASITRKMATKNRPLRMPIGSRFGINQPFRPP